MPPSISRRSRSAALERVKACSAGDVGLLIERVFNGLLMPFLDVPDCCH